MTKKKDPARIPVNALERIAKEQFPETITESWFDIPVTIRRTLPLKEMMEFTNDLVVVCFTENGEFVPEVLDFAIKSGVLTRYGNFELPDDLEKQYWLIYNTGAFDMVIQYINGVQLREFTDAANRKLKYLCDNDIQVFRLKMTELINSINNVQTQTANVLDGLSSEDIGIPSATFARSQKCDLPAPCIPLTKTILIFPFIMPLSRITIYNEHEKMIRTIKSVTAREIYSKHPEVKKKLWGGEFWSDGYYVGTVGKHGNESIISKYVKAQETEESYKTLSKQPLNKLFFSAVSCSTSFSHALTGILVISSLWDLRNAS